MQPAAREGKEAIIAGGVDGFRAALLRWYDAHRRVLPWRAAAGEVADPYHVWLSEVMLQQTVVAAAGPYFMRFIEKWPRVADLAQAPQDDVMEAWAGLGYYARARNLHKCAQIVAGEMGGHFPQERTVLKALPGIGDYTSAAICAIAFDRPATVIDGNVERVIARFFAIKTPLPRAKKEIKAAAESLSEGRADRPGDFAQAMMDLGATVCTPQSPSCGQCPLAFGCRARSEGIAASLPYKEKKRDRLRRYGYVYWIEREGGDVLIERRGETGMLAGMPGFPCSAWEIERTALCHPAAFSRLSLRQMKGAAVFHSFTHFDLELTGLAGFWDDAAGDIPVSFRWAEKTAVQNLGLPTLFKKFVRFVQEDAK